MIFLELLAAIIFQIVIASLVGISLYGYTKAALVHCVMAGGIGSFFMIIVIFATHIHCLEKENKK